MAQLDSDIAKVLVKIGGADPSALNLGISSPSPLRRNPKIETMFPCTPPRSPMLRKKDHGGTALLSPTAVQFQFFRQNSCPVGVGNGSLLTVDTPLSLTSSLNDVREDENEEDEELKYRELYSKLSEHRRSSHSLPDLREINNSTLHEVAEEDDSDEEILPLRNGNVLQRRDSCSLPDLKGLLEGGNNTVLCNNLENDDHYDQETFDFSPTSKPSLEEQNHQQRYNNVHQSNNNDHIKAGLQTRL